MKEMKINTSELTATWPLHNKVPSLEYKVIKQTRVST